MEVEVRVGCYGWQWSQWERSFYPEDLPEDWQLDFYANYFRTVLVPHSQWLSADEEELEGWLDSVQLDEDDFEDEEAYDAQPPFLFYLSIEHPLNAQEMERLQQVCAVLGDYCGGTIDSEKLVSKGAGLYQQSLGQDVMWLGIYPVSITDPKAQGQWAKEFSAQVLQQVSQTRVPEMPVFVGNEGGHFDRPQTVEQAQSLKLLLEMLA